MRFFRLFFFHSVLVFVGARLFFKTNEIFAIYLNGIVDVWMFIFKGSCNEWRERKSASEMFTFAVLLFGHGFRMDFSYVLILLTLNMLHTHITCFAKAIHSS